MADEPHVQDGPFPIRIDVATLPKSGFPVSEIADDARRAAIAAQYGLTEVERFKVEGRLFRWKSQGARFEGQLQAAVTAACVVTEEPVPQTIEMPLRLTFVPDGSRLTRSPVDADGELVVDLEAEDPPEVFTGNVLDIGDTVLELFSLELDPFPRSGSAPSHVEFTTQTEDEATDDKPSPFAALSALKASNSNKDG